MTPEEIEKRLAFARAVAEDAGKIALRYFRQPLEVENKLEGEQFDPVTRADREVEAEIRQKLGEAYPDDSIIGEEAGTSEGSSDIAWIIDPIDGTRAFISGVPAWGTLLGLMESDNCVGGLMHQPYIGETFVGGPSGAFLYRQGQQTALRSRQGATLGDAILYCTHPNHFESEADLAGFQRVAEASRLYRFGGDCYSYCLLAQGQIDLVIEGGLQPYDIIPLIPLIEAAGGVVTDRDGRPATKGGLIVAAANARLHAEALALLNG
ncbi:histidinol-phosphatase [Marinobacterium aestuariivivens]|uniref:Histidinol-phosphatase n=1 Tax=Marinobacterium aestuariivivens TaxID=1698799 RepID=A0ABW2A316_9GAMM